MPAARERESRGWRVTVLLAFAALVATVLGLVLAFELDPSAQPLPALPWRRGSLTLRDAILLFMALTALGGMFALVMARRAGAGHGFQVSLLLVTVLAGLNYFYTIPGLYTSQFAHRHDTFHYLLNPRYFGELGYTELYACTLSELENWEFPNAYPVRDLRNYERKTAGEIRQSQPCEGVFAEERLERWRQDLQVYTAGNGLTVLHRSLADNGYNGPPFHAAVAGAIADRIPLTQATHALVPMLDVAVLSAMAVAVVWVFGWQVGLIFALFLFTNVADRWAITGASFFRYPWMALLALSLAALHLRRHATAGALMALSTLFTVFPVVFAAGIAVRAAVETWSQRSIPVHYRRFFVAALLTGVLGVGLGEIPREGVGNHIAWLQNMEMHNVERFQRFGVGLKFPFIFRGGITEATDDVPEAIRQIWFHEVRPWYWALATVYLALALLIAARTDDDVEASGVLGFTLFFVLLGTVSYYFAAAAMMVLVLHRWIREPVGALLIALFFLTSLLGHAALYLTLYYRFTFNTVLSTGWSIWLLLVLLWLVWRLGLLSRQAWTPARRGQI